MPPRRIRRTAALALAAALLGLPAARGQNQGVTVTPDEKSFETADGVKLRGLFYRGPKGPSGPVVLMLHAYKANPDEAVWSDTAKLLVEKGFSVFRFDFRGHGKSTDVVPAKFWINPVNKQNVALTRGFTHATDSSIKYDDFRSNYYPMLVQDLAAARNVLDQMNDTGEVNASSIYLLGAGDAANLGLFFLATEWLRERQKPNVGVPPNFVSPRRSLFPGADPAGMDYAGAIWLGPARAPAGGITTRQLQEWVISPYALQLRNDTSMLFLYGEKDSAGAGVAKSLYNDVLMVKKTAGPGGQKLLPPEQTFLREVPKTALSGVKLLGNNVGTEKMVDDFLTAVEKERKGKTRKTREWDKPLIIDVQAFGAVK